MPRCFKWLRYYCPDDDDEEKTFYKVLQYANKVEICNITGEEKYIEKLNEIADQVGEKCDYLFLQFDGEPGNEDIAKQYVEIFRKFKNISTIRFEVIEDGNLTNILKLIMADVTFPWLTSVRIAKCY